MKQGEVNTDVSFYAKKLNNHAVRLAHSLYSRKALDECSLMNLWVSDFLYNHRGEDIFQKDIEEEYSIRPSTASEMLKQMEERGLIRRETVPYDNRLKKVVLTEKALVCRQQVREDLTRLEETLTQGIPPEDMEVFFRVIEKMMDNLAE